MTVVSQHLDAIIALIGQGLSNTQIGRELGISRQVAWRIRGELGLPQAPPPHLPAAGTLEEAFYQRTRDAGDGHLAWTGTHSAGRTAVFTHHGTDHTAGRVAFFLHHHRQPEGTVKPECGRRGCVAPQHVEDAPGRARIRSLHRDIFRQLPAPARHCGNGHDQATEGRYDADGHTYCAACQRAADTRRKARRAVAA